MGKIILDDNYIKSLPITTNRIEVSWDKDKFFAKYSIVSYYSTDPERKNLAYEQLGNVPFISVTGIKNRWGAQHFPSVQFFILTTKGKEQEVLNSLRAYNDVKAGNNTLEKYKDKLQQRIIASLAINSLGKKKNSNMMYNDGSLLVCDDKNFGARKSRKELVCLKIEVNEYMNLTARTTSFSNPFNEKPTPDDIIIKLCEPKEEGCEVTQYSQSMVRLSNNGNALQHITYYGDEKLDLLDTPSVRRILIELIVKDSLAKRIMPKPLANMLEGWNAIRYKINQGNVHGASLKIDNQGSIDVEQYGLSQDNQGEDFEDFISQKLKYFDYDKIRGARDYMALVKDGNVYFIVDTDEIPILDVNLIDEAYSKVANNGETVAMFKRKKVAHKYLRGYIGFHLWKTDGIDGNPEGSYSYISGTNSESMKITPKTKMDKMPRARRIFILHKENPELIDQQILEICKMLKFGFGRWNELMTYPFPFKFLQEYLDDAAETAYSLHWKDITLRKDL